MNATVTTTERVVLNEDLHDPGPITFIYDDGTKETLDPWREFDEEKPHPAEAERGMKGRYKEGAPGCEVWIRTDAEASSEWGRSISAQQSRRHSQLVRLRKRA